MQFLSKREIEYIFLKPTVQKSQEQIQSNIKIL